MKKEKDNIEMTNGVLLFVYKDERAKNLQYLKVLFKEDLILNLGSHILVNSDRYYNLENSSTDAQLIPYNTGQFIFTYSRFKSLILKMISLGFDIDKIDFWEDIEKYQRDFLEELMKELKRTDISPLLRETLLKEVFKIMETIDLELFTENGVSQIIFRSKNNEYIKFHRNNNIEFNISNINIIKETLSIFKEY